MNIKTLSLILLSIPFTLGGCSNSQTSTNHTKIICPKGAPSLAFYDQGNNEKFETASPMNVKSQLLSTNYGMVVFDFYNGLNVLKNKESYDKNKDFKLARIITGGNFYLAGINTTSKPTASSKIVAFSKNSLPDLVFKKVIGDEIYNNLSYVNDNEAASVVLQSGMLEGENVDYVLISEPLLYQAMNNKSAATYGKVNIISSLRDDWKSLTNQDYIPQAGLFIRQEDYDKYNLYFNDQLGLMNERIDNLIEDLDTVEDKMNSTIPSEVEQKNIFGITSSIVKEVQDESKNRLAFIPESDLANINIQTFLTSLNISVDYSDYMLVR